MPGPKPKPTALKIVEGNPGKRPLPANEPKPRPVRPDPPAFLNEKARTIWDSLAGELESLGILTHIDQSTLAGYCASYEEAMRLDRYLQRVGLTYKSPSGYIQQRPHVSIRNKAWDRVAKFGSELGIGAASRSRIEVKKADGDDNPLAELLAEAKAEQTARRRPR